MKTQFISVYFFFLFSFSVCQLDKNKAINSCGKLADYAQPDNQEDCKPGGSHFQCCFVEIPENEMKYCSYLSGTINNDIIEQFKTTLSLDSVTIKCNNSSYLFYNSLPIIVFLLLSLMI